MDRKLKNISVVITGVGAPGIKGTVYSLKNNFDNRQIKIIGTDINSDAVGKYFCDKFYQIPKASDKKKYLETILDICKKNSVDVLIPQNTIELSLLSSNIHLFSAINTKIVISSYESIEVANNKFLLMSKCKELGIPVGDFFLVNNFDDLKKHALKLGWPNKNFVVKPPVSNGMRGVRIISDSINRKHNFYNEKPSSLVISMDDLYAILGDTFDDLIVTEFLPGNEFTVDVYRDNKNTISIPRVRNVVRSGITFNGELSKNLEIIKYSDILANNLNLKNCFGFQFKIDENGVPKILESNPRVQGTMILSTLANANIIYASVKNLLNEEIPNFDINWHTKFIRFWGGVGIGKNTTII